MFIHTCTYTDTHTARAVVNHSSINAENVNLFRLGMKLVLCVLPVRFQVVFIIRLCSNYITSNESQLHPPPPPSTSHTPLKVDQRD